MLVMVCRALNSKFRCSHLSQNHPESDIDHMKGKTLENIIGIGILSRYVLRQYDATFTNTWKILSESSNLASTIWPLTLLIKRVC